MQGDVGEVPLRTWIGFLAMAVGTFMAILDIQIVASSLPEIGAGFGATVEEASWLQTSYMIAEVITIPLAGWLSRALSLRYLYSLACALFTLASLLCGLAWSMEAMIAIRVFQGAFAGLMGPLLYQGIYLFFPRERQAGVTLFVVLIVSLAPIVGPTVGGWITQTWSWRWLFFLNLLPGMAVTASVFALVRGESPRWDLLRNLDMAGIALAALFLGPLEYVLGEGPDEDWFDSRTVAALAALSALSGTLFLWRELSCRVPVVNLRAFRDRNFSTGCLLNFVMGFGLFGSGYLMTLFLSAVKEYNSLQIGRVMAVPGVAMMASVPLARVLRRTIDGRTCLAVGLALFALALWSNSSLTAASGFEHLFWPQVLRGMAVMFCLSPVTELALGRLPREAVPNATGLYALMRSLGGGIGIAVINTLVENRSALHCHRLAEGLSPGRFPGGGLPSEYEAPFTDFLPEGEASPGSTRFFAAAVRTQALTMTFNDIWLAVALLFGATLLLLPFVRKVDRPS